MRSSVRHSALNSSTTTFTSRTPRSSGSRRKYRTGSSANISRCFEGPILKGAASGTAVSSLSPCGCSDRGHRGRGFGDILAAFEPAVEGPDVDGCNHLGSEYDVEDAILGCWPERDGLAAEGLGEFDGAAEEADVTALLNTAHDVARSVFEGRDGLDIVARAGLIAAGRDSQLDRLVRSLRVVDVAPALEGPLGGGDIG